MQSTSSFFLRKKTCWPNEGLQSQYPDSPNEYRFLNSGGFIGYGGPYQHYHQQSGG